MADGPDAEALLARFPGPVTVTVNRRRTAIAFAVAVPLAPLAIYALIDRIRLDDWYDTIMTVLGIGVIVLLTLRLAVLVLRPRAMGLTLDAGGFTYNAAVFTTRAAWHEASGFRSANDSVGNPAIAYDQRSPRGKAKMRVLPDNYQLPREELVRLLTGWRQRALAAETISGTSPAGAANLG